MSHPACISYLKSFFPTPLMLKLWSPASIAIIFYFILFYFLEIPSLSSLTAFNYSILTKTQHAVITQLNEKRLKLIGISLIRCTCLKYTYKIYIRYVLREEEKNLNQRHLQ